MWWRKGRNGWGVPTVPLATTEGISVLFASVNSSAVCVHVCAYAYVCVSVCMYVCICECVSVCMYVCE
jgi:hypothetical protein